MAPSSIWHEDSGWRPLPPGEFGADLSRSHPHYSVDALLGWGGMGAVYVGQDQRSGVRVAFKMLRPDAVDDPDARRRFRDEVASLSLLRHPNVVALLDSGISMDGSHFLVMELLEGQTLAQLLRRSAPFTPERIVEIMVQVCAGVDYIHAQGYAHRDLKAANIFLTKEGRAVVLDFGIARPFAKPLATASRLAIPGTEGYVAPEVLEGQPATPRSDVFALGVVFLHMVTGEVPRAGHAWPSDRGFAPSYDDVAKKALERDPADRWQSAAEFGQQLADSTEPRRVLDQPERAHDFRPAADPAGWPSAMTDAPRAIVDTASPARLKVHRSVLASWSDPHRSRRADAEPVVPTRTEEWEVVDRWNAFPNMPSFAAITGRVHARFAAQRNSALAALALSAAGTVWFGRWTVGIPWLELLPLAPVAGLLAAEPTRRLAARVFDWLTRMQMPAGIVWTWPERPSLFVSDFWRKRVTSQEYDPHVLLWHPHESHLIAARDHYCFATWWWEPSRAGGGPRAEGPRLLTGFHDLFAYGRLLGVTWSSAGYLVRSESFWWWDGQEPTEHWIIYDARGNPRGWIVPQWRWSTGLFGPEEKGVLLCNPWRPGRLQDLLVLLAPDQLALLDAFSLPHGRGLLEAPVELTPATKERLSVAALRVSAAETVDSYAWHPSGAYLAIGIAGRVYIVHWDSAELVAQHVPPLGETYAAREWNEYGTLLALDARAERVWDARAGVARLSQPSERWSIRAAGSLERRRTSCDGARRFAGETGFTPDFGTWRGMDGVTDVTWSPHDPDMFATVGGTGCERDIRVWRRKGAPMPQDR